MERREGFPFAFACRRSGNCCAIPGGEVRVTPAETAALAAHLGLSAAAFGGRYLRADGATLVDGLGSRCVFLRDGPEPACGVYPVRPQQCRTWPFWESMREDRELLAFARRTCPGIVDLADAGPPA